MSITGLIGYFTFGINASLLDTAQSLGNLQAYGNPSYTADGPWPGSQCTILNSYSDSSGLGQYFRVPSLNLGSMSISTGFSICSWFAFNATTRWARIFDFGAGQNNQNIILSREGVSNNLRFANVYDTYTEETILPNPIINGKWRHVCVVNQGRNWTVYDDGTIAVFQIASASIKNVLLTSNFIGRSNWAIDKLLIGRIDEFRIYQKSLLPSDVTRIYSARFSITGLDCYSIEAITH